MAKEHEDAGLDDHPGLDNDEASEKGKMMTAEGSVSPGPEDEDEDGEPMPRTAS